MNKYRVTGKKFWKILVLDTVLRNQIEREFISPSLRHVSTRPRGSRIGGSTKGPAARVAQVFATQAAQNDSQSVATVFWFEN